MGYGADSFSSRGRWGLYVHKQGGLDRLAKSRHLALRFLKHPQDTCTSEEYRRKRCWNTRIVFGVRSPDLYLLPMGGLLAMHEMQMEELRLHEVRQHYVPAIDPYFIMSVLRRHVLRYVIILTVVQPKLVP